MKKVNLKKYLILMSVFALVGAGIITFCYWKFRASENVDNADILQSIYESNSSLLLDRGSLKGWGENTLESATAQDSAAGVNSNFDSSQNYYFLKETIIPGSKVNDCSALFVSDEKRIYEYYNYWDENGSYYKSITYNANGDIETYYLQNEDGYYEYMGGEYAVKKLINITGPILMQTETVKDVAVDIDDSESVNSVDEDYAEEDAVIEKEYSEEISEEEYYWGEDETVEIIIEDGVEYYVVTWSYQTNCDLEYVTRSVSGTTVSSEEITETNDEDLRTIYNRYWSTVDDYEMVKQETYIDGVSDSNLVSTTLTEMISEETAYSKVSSNFVFDLDVDVKEIDMTSDYVDAYTDLDGYIDFVDSFIEENRLVLIEPLADSMEFSYEYINYEYPYLNDYYGYLVDRDFYSDSSFGEESYEDALNSYWLKSGSNALANFNYKAKEIYLGEGGTETLQNSVDYTDSINSRSLSVVIFEESISDEDIWDNYVGRDNMETLTKTIELDGELIDVVSHYREDNYAVDYEVSVSYEGTEGSEGSDEMTEIWEGDNYEYADFYIIVSKNGFKYLINFFQQDTTVEECELPGFISNDLTDEDNRNNFLSKIKNVYNESSRDIEEPDTDPLVGVKTEDE